MQLRFRLTPMQPACYHQVDYSKAVPFKAEHNPLPNAFGAD
jgi:hypothetical protein